MHPPIKPVGDFPARYPACPMNCSRGISKNVPGSSQPEALHCGHSYSDASSRFAVTIMHIQQSHSQNRLVSTMSLRSSGTPDNKINEISLRCAPLFIYKPLFCPITCSGESRIPNKICRRFSRLLCRCLNFRSLASCPSYRPTNRPIVRAGLSPGPFP